MGRNEVIQRLIGSVPNSNYLEIGVQNGYTFHAIKASWKVAVDPHFAFDLEAARQGEENQNCRYFEMTSDEYFSVACEPHKRFNLIFIDGLHTFEQTLRDLMNAITRLSHDGIIVIDDVMPVTYASSISDIVHFSRFRESEGFADGSWMGDVFKLIFFIRYYMPMFSFATVKENHGQTVMWRSRRKLDDHLLSVEAVSRLDFSDFALNKDKLNILPMSEIEQLVEDARTGALR